MLQVGLSQIKAELPMLVSNITTAVLVQRHASDPCSQRRLWWKHDGLCANGKIANEGSFRDRQSRLFPFHIHAAFRIGGLALTNAVVESNLSATAETIMSNMSQRDEGTKAMTIDRAVMMFAGFMALLSLALGFYLSPWWYLLNAFVGLNLMQASVTGFCPAAIVFRRLGIKAGSAFE